MIPDFATSTIGLMNQDILLMYAFAPLIALCIFIIAKQVKTILL